MHNNETKLLNILNQKSLNNLKTAGFDVNKLQENIKQKKNRAEELDDRKKKNSEEKRLLNIFFSIINQKNKSEELKKLKQFGAIYTNTRGRVEFRPFSKYKVHFMNYIKQYVITNTNYRPGYSKNKRGRIRWKEKN